MLYFCYHPELVEVKTKPMNSHSNSVIDEQLAIIYFKAIFEADFSNPTLLVSAY